MTSNGMRSCSRIARRCGDFDASRSGGAGGALTAYARSTPGTQPSSSPNHSASSRYELAEERLLPVLVVVPLGELARDREKPRRADDEPAPLEPCEDLARELPAHRVGLDQHERALHRSAESRRLLAAPAPLGRLKPRQLAERRRLDRS